MFVRVSVIYIFQQRFSFGMIIFLDSIFSMFKSQSHLRSIVSVRSKALISKLEPSTIRRNCSGCNRNSGRSNSSKKLPEPRRTQPFKDNSEPPKDSKTMKVLFFLEMCLITLRFGCSIINEVNMSDSTGIQCVVI